MSLIDLHVHLLPGVDDGPPDEAASLTHARRLMLAGVREATVTPHVGHPSFPLDVARIPERTAALQATLHRERIGLRLHAGLDALAPELVRGAVLQVSVCSLLGHHGEEARTAGEHLVGAGLAYLLASDGH